MKDESCQEFDGRIIKSVINNDSEALLINFEDGTAIKMHHYQNCCESVAISECDIPSDISGAIFYRIEEKSGQPSNYENDFEQVDFYFYEIHTSRGSIEVHWQGISNGYYSTSVDICNINCRD